VGSNPLLPRRAFIGTNPTGKPITSGLPVTREQRGSVELVQSSNECIGYFESTEEAFCCPDFRVTTWALCIDPPFAKLIRGSWFANVVIMSERSTEQIRELLDPLSRGFGTNPGNSDPLAR
jgi:hypothetical protein